MNVFNDYEDKIFKQIIQILKTGHEKTREYAVTSLASISNHLGNFLCNFLRNDFSRKI